MNTNKEIKKIVKKNCAMYKELLHGLDTEKALNLMFTSLIYSVYEIIINTIDGDIAARMSILESFQEGLMNNFGEFNDKTYSQV